MLAAVLAAALAAATAEGAGGSGSTGGSGQDAGGSETVPLRADGSRLAKTGYGIGAGGAPVGVMAPVGAAIRVACSFLEGEFSEE